MPEEVIFESEQRQSRQEIASYLQTIAEKIRGTLEIAVPL